MKTFRSTRYKIPMRTEKMSVMLRDYRGRPRGVKKTNISRKIKRVRRTPPVISREMLMRLKRKKIRGMKAVRPRVIPYVKTPPPSRVTITRRKRSIKIMSPPRRGILPVRKNYRKKPVVKNATVKNATVKNATVKNATVKKVNSMITKNRKKFVLWMKKTHPKLYNASLLKVGGTFSLQGLGAHGEEIASSSSSGWFSNLVGSIGELAPSYLQFKQQKDIMRAQLQRAKAGLPPMNVADYTPVLKTQIDLAPKTRNALIKETSNLIMPLMIGGGVLLAILAIKKLK